MKTLLLLSTFGVISPGLRAGDPEKELLQRAVDCRPHARQLAWQRREMYAFVHFGVNTFTDREWGDGKEDPKIFAPSALDARQWTRAFKSAGLSMVILTAKHHDGFCLWPSRYTSHSVAASPWKEGKGDVVKELADACRADGLRFGFYLSPADLHEIEASGGRYGNGSAAVKSPIPAPEAGARPFPASAKSSAKSFEFEVDDYNRYFLSQLYELLTEYGKVDEVWFDGANPKPKGNQRYAYAAWYRLIRELQPEAVIFGKGPDVRWVGNERGRARESEWSVIPLAASEDLEMWEDRTGDDLGSREKLRGAAALHWYPAEADVSIRPGWFHHAAEDGQVKSVRELLDIYHDSVGRNASLILNVPPDRRGLLGAADARILSLFGRRLQETYGPQAGGIFNSEHANVKNLAHDAGVRGEDGSASAPPSIIDGHYGTFWQGRDGRGPWELKFDLPKEVTFNRLLLQEQITRSQRIESFVLEAWQEDHWQEIARGTTVGYKRLLRFPDVKADRVRLRIERARLSPTLAEFGLFFEAPGE